MRRDLIIGFIVSAGIHAGLLFGFKSHLPPPKKAAPPPAIQIMDMPKDIEPELPKDTETSDQPVKPMDFAPPMQTDVPQIATDTSFVQQMQPPPPPNLKPTTGLLTIPENRDLSTFRGMQVFDLSALDTPPQPRVQIAPQYPFEMKRAGITGEVTVEFIVDTDGDVQNAYVVRSSQREFEQPALQAISKWKFKPGRKNGRYVPVRMQQPFSFTLNNDE